MNSGSAPEPSRLSPLVYRGETAQGKPCVPMQHLFRSGYRAGRAEPQISQKQRPVSKLHPAADRAHPQLHGGSRMPFPPDRDMSSSKRIWRLPVLNDEKVFLRSEEENNPGFTVDLLLDGSGLAPALSGDYRSAGLHSGHSLATCGIPVRVSSFCSPRGYTVVQDSQGFQREKRGKKNFHLLLPPAGIDGLALRTAGKLLDTAPADRHLLIPADRCQPG